MNQKSRAVDFDQLVKELHEQPIWSRHELSIWGGICAETNLLTLLENWVEMPYCIWEYASRIDFLMDQLPKAGDVQWLERGRIFGEGGDLSLRRQGDGFYWYFVGPHGRQSIPSTNKYGVKDFFTDSEPSAKFYMREETALLWGEKSPDRPHRFEDRVRRADLDYPGCCHAQRVEVRYRAFSRAGRVEFVWFRTIEPMITEGIDNG